MRSGMAVASAPTDGRQKGQLIAGLKRGLRVGELVVDGDAHAAQRAWQLQAVPEVLGVSGS